MRRTWMTTTGLTLAVMAGLAGDAHAQWRSAGDGEGSGAGPRTGETCIRVGLGSALFLHGALGVGVSHRPAGSKLRFSFELGYRLLTGPDIKNSSDRGEVSGAETVLIGLGVFV